MAKIEKDIVKIMERATKIAIDPLLSGEENTARALALGVIVMQAFNEHGLDTAEAFLVAAATTKQHQLSCGHLVR